MSKETLRLNQITKNSLSYDNGVNSKMVEYSYKLVERFLVGENILELGPAEGVMTEFLAKSVKNLTVVEGSKGLADSLSEKYTNVEVVNSLFENFKPNKKFDFIILGHVLEHVESPVEILKLVETWLKHDGLIFAAVPNSNSIHRQTAVLMGLLETQKSMSQLDIDYGHRRIYDFDELKNDFVGAGLKIIKNGGYWLKPLSNKQLEECWTSDMVEASMILGEKYPEIAAEIYILATKA